MYGSLYERYHPRPAIRREDPLPGCVLEVGQSWLALRAGDGDTTFDDVW